MGVCSHGWLAGWLAGGGVAGWLAGWLAGGGVATGLCSAYMCCVLLKSAPLVSESSVSASSLPEALSLV